jgi:hypothetical protein
MKSLLNWSMVSFLVIVLDFALLLHFSLSLSSLTTSHHRHSNSGPPSFFLIWSLPRLWYGSLSGSISLNHLSILYNINYGIGVTNDHGYVLFAIITIWSFPHSWHITGFVTRVTRWELNFCRMKRRKKEHLNLLRHPYQKRSHV